MITIIPQNKNWQNQCFSEIFYPSVHPMCASNIYKLCIHPLRVCVPIVGPPCTSILCIHHAHLVLFGSLIDFIQLYAPDLSMNTRTHMFPVGQVQLLGNAEYIPYLCKDI